MTQLNEKSLMITKTVEYHKGKTVKQLREIKDCWLNNYSTYGISIWLEVAENNGWVYVRSNKKGELLYYATKKGIKEYDKQFN